MDEVISHALSIRKLFCETSDIAPNPFEKPSVLTAQSHGENRSNSDEKLAQNKNVFSTAPTTFRCYRI